MNKEEFKPIIIDDTNSAVNRAIEIVGTSNHPKLSELISDEKLDKNAPVDIKDLVTMNVHETKNLLKTLEDNTELIKERQEKLVEERRAAFERERKHQNHKILMKAQSKNKKIKRKKKAKNGRGGKK